MMIVLLSLRLEYKTIHSNMHNICSRKEKRIRKNHYNHSNHSNIRIIIITIIILLHHRCSNIKVINRILDRYRVHIIIHHNSSTTHKCTNHSNSIPLRMVMYIEVMVIFHPELL